MTATPAQERPGRTAARLVQGAVSGVVLVAVLLVGLATIVVPVVLGATPYTVLTRSMEPGMPPGTLVVTRPVSVDDIGTGDVVTYQLRSGEPTVVTHRVIGVGSNALGETVFSTMGDANAVPDEPVRAVQVRGVVVYQVPYLGYVNTWVGANRPGWLLKSVAGALILYGIVLVGIGVRDRVRRKAADEAPASVPVGPVPADVGTSVAVRARPTGTAVEPSSPPPAGRSRSAPAPAVVVTLVVLTGVVLGVALLARRDR
ncbi:signal peptidase I [Cellulomonas sp.]|uniref:signal peptidase I n=1 Tax=Cellulomonas sp. TaxID=40001 RepID=UPI003BAC04D9